MRGALTFVALLVATCRAAAQDVAPQPIPVVVREALSQELAKHTVVERSLPAHPLADQLLDTILREAVARLPLDSGTLLRALAVTYGDRAFGLYAFEVYLRDTPPAENPAAFCEWLCAEHSELRSSGMALDYLLRQSADPVALTESWAERAGASRLGITARLRRADLAYTSSPLTAARWLLNAWALNPPDTLRTPVASRTCALLNRQDQALLLHPLTSPAPDVPVPTGIVRRAQASLESLVAVQHARQEEFLDALWHRDWTSLRDLTALPDAPLAWKLHGGFALAEAGLRQPDREGSTLTQMELLLALARTETDLSGWRAADLGVAGYLLGKPNTTLSSVPPASPEEAAYRLEQLAHLGTLRASFLSLATQTDVPLLDDERAYYAMLIARRQVLAFDSARAAATLAAAEALPRVSPAYRDALAALRAHLDDPAYFGSQEAGR